MSKTYIPTEDIKQLAASGAKKICGQGECSCGYHCGNANKMVNTIPIVGDGGACPLKKYDIQPEENPKPWHERPAEEVVVSQDELFALCACCEHGKVSLDGECEYAGPKDDDTLLRHCLDCPVYNVIEWMQEGAAEAACS